MPSRSRMWACKGPRPQHPMPAGGSAGSRGPERAGRRRAAPQHQTGAAAATPRVRGGRGLGVRGREGRPGAVGASRRGRHGPWGLVPPGSCPGTAGEGEACRQQVRRRQGTLPGPGLQEAREDVRGPGALPAAREPAGRRLLWHPHQRNREGRGGCPTSKLGLVTGRAAGHTRVAPWHCGLGRVCRPGGDGRWEIATLEGVEQPCGGSRRPRRAVEPPGHVPRRRWASASAGPQAGGGAAGPSPRGGESGQACPTAPSPGRGRGDIRAAGCGRGLSRPRRSLHGPARRPEGGSRGQVTASRSVGACAHTRTDAAEPGRAGGAGREAEGIPAALHPHSSGSDGSRPGALGRHCLPFSPPPPPRLVGGEC